MTNIINREDWLVEFDIPALGGQPDQGAFMPPTTQPGSPGNPMGVNGDLDQAPANQDGPAAPQDQDQEEEDVNQDPDSPDMPDDFNKKDDHDGDFEVWKGNFFKESIKGDTNVLLDLLREMRYKKMEPSQKKFIRDNLQVQYLRQHANVLEISKDIRSLIKKELDHNNPATALVEHISMSVDKSQYLSNVFLRLGGLSYQGDAHRKFIASLIGAVQVGSGADKEDIIFEDNDYSIKISTRFNAKFGDVNLSHWSMLEDDPERFLKEPELRKLEDGSPEEKDVLRRRVVMESIAEQFKERAFVINVVDDDGTIYYLGLDLATCLKSAYTEGKLVVRTRHSDNSEAMITDDGAIVPYLDLSIQYTQETGQTDPDGMPETEELDFIERRNGMLFIVASLDVLRNASAAMQGMNFKEVPYRGNPSDVPKIAENIPSMTEILMRNN